MSIEQQIAEQILSDIHNPEPRHALGDYIEESQCLGGYDLGQMMNEDERVRQLRSDQQYASEYGGGFYFVAEVDNARSLYRDKWCLWYSCDGRNCCLIGPLDHQPKCSVCKHGIKGRIVTRHADAKLCCELSVCQRKFLGDDPQDIFRRYTDGRPVTLNPAEIAGAGDG